MNSLALDPAWYLPSKTHATLPHRKIQQKQQNKSAKSWPEFAHCSSESVVWYRCNLLNYLQITPAGFRWFITTIFKLIFFNMRNTVGRITFPMLPVVRCARRRIGWCVMGFMNVMPSKRRKWVLSPSVDFVDRIAGRPCRSFPCGSCPIFGILWLRLYSCCWQADRQNPVRRVSCDASIGGDSPVSKRKWPCSSVRTGNRQASKTDGGLLERLAALSPVWFARHWCGIVCPALWRQPGTGGRFRFDASTNLFPRLFPVAALYSFPSVSRLAYPSRRLIYWWKKACERKLRCFVMAWSRRWSTDKSIGPLIWRRYRARRIRCRSMANSQWKLWLFIYGNRRHLDRRRNLQIPCRYRRNIVPISSPMSDLLPVYFANLQLSTHRDNKLYQVFLTLNQRIWIYDAIRLCRYKSHQDQFDLMAQFMFVVRIEGTSTILLSLAPEYSVSGLLLICTPHSWL